MDGSIFISFYTTNTPDHEETVHATLDICQQIGLLNEHRESFDPDAITLNDGNMIPLYWEWPDGDAYKEIRVSFGTEDWSAPIDSTLKLTTTAEALVTERATDPEYTEFMEAFLRLIKKLTLEIDPYYVSTFNTTHRGEVAPSPETVLPRTVPIDLDRLPWLGIYSESLVEQFGGRERVLDTPAWRVKELDNGSILIITTKMPWENYDERQPADKYLLDGEDIPAEEDDAGRTQLGLTDPFAALDPGEYGAEVGVHPEMMGEEFRNEDLQLLRVRRDEDGALRRTDDEAVVRRVVTDTSGDDHDIVGRQFEFLPPDATDEDRRASALLHPAIPPSFVRLDSPTDENVVTRVMNLDVGTEKIPLLISLGQAAKQDGSGHDAESIESALENLAELEDVAGIERWIEDNLI